MGDRLFLYHNDWVSSYDNLYLNSYLSLLRCDRLNLVGRQVFSIGTKNLPKSADWEVFLFWGLLLRRLFSLCRYVRFEQAYCLLEIGLDLEVRRHLI